jgi:hypothetical protein
MSKELNTNLLKSLLKSDFLILTSKKQKNLKHLDKFFKVNGDTNLAYLNISVLLKSLKQQIRLIQFLNSQMSDQKNISLELNSKKLISLSNKFFKEYPVDLSVDTNISKQQQKLKFYGLFLSLNSKVINKIINVNKSKQDNKISLISTFNNSTFNNKDLTYKVYNSIDSNSNILKFIFLLCFIRQTLIKK